MTAVVYLGAVGAELTTAQRELIALSATLGAPNAVLGSTPSEQALAALGSAGVSRVYAAKEDPSGSLCVGQADALVGVVRATEARIVLCAAQARETEVVARAAALTESAMITQAVKVDTMGEGELTSATDVVVTKDVLSGEWASTVRATSASAFLTCAPGVAAPQQLSADLPSAELIPISTDARSGAAIISRTPQETDGRPDLSTARTIVAGGRGTGGDFAPVEDLADALGAAIGATRDATDEGWVPHGMQVGQTGVTVRPELYIAAGISGAVHHLSGMRHSGTIIAINSDMDAPIFDLADFGIVGDLSSVLPQAAQSIRERQQQAPA